jgi:serine/threonine protein kinase
MHSDPIELEDLVTQAIVANDTDGSAGIERVCREHPTHAGALRERLEVLRNLGLLGVAAKRMVERLGDFRLLRELGAGGMGVVYVAVQESLGREVALKVIRPDQLFFADARERFRREVEIVARLHHPGIVPVHTVGEAGGIPYFAMELLHGQPLNQVLAAVEKRPSNERTGSDLAPEGAAASYLFAGTWEEACLRIVRQVAEAVDHAHRQGVLHRDIKPSNIFLTSGANCRAVLLDFGLAASGSAGQITRTGAQMGSLHYMAPEQVRAEAKLVGPRTDVYALGVTLYEMLTLNPAFRGSSDVEILQRIAEANPRSPREIDPRLSWEAETVCLTAMEQEPARRYASAADLARDLGNVLERRPIEARRVGLWRRTWRWVQRSPARATAIGLGGLLVFGGPIAIAWQQQIAAQRLAVQRDRAERNFEAALSAVDRMLARLGAVDLRFLPQMEPVRKAVLEDAVTLLEGFVADQGTDPRARRAAADTHAHLATLHTQLGSAVAAAASNERAIAIFDELAAAAAPLGATAHGAALLEAAGQRIEYIKTLSTAGRLTDQAAVHAQVEATLAQVPADPSLATRRDTLRVLDATWRGKLALGQQERDRGRSELETATQRAEALLASAGADLGILSACHGAYNELGMALIQAFTGEQEANPAAIAALDRAMELARRLVDAAPESSDYRLGLVNALNNHAGALRRASRFDDALVDCRAALIVAEKLAKDFPESGSFLLELATVNNQIALLHEYKKETPAAEPFYLRTVEILEELVERAPREAMLWHRLGLARFNRSSPQNHRKDFGAAADTVALALDAYRRAIALAPELVDYRGNLAFATAIHARLRRQNGEYERAFVAAQEMTAARPGVWKDHTGAAVELARLLETVRGDEAVPDEEKLRWARRCSEAAVEKVRSALALQAPVPKDLRDLKDVAALHDTEAFEALRQELLARGK